MTQTALKSESEILGYQLIERIGSGGFGEVWSAIAPGGLKKAIKVVYGYHDGHRAQAELKALDRVKELRHPFLLSLERIEIYEGQLVVVSELADCCLADVFNQFILKGEPGIPREDLLKYLRNAAEALDYLSDEHSLQHLDIKPENLLIVGTHVKVADFGLIKDLQHVSQSLMSGMTPAYAAPELFDGRPGSSSDQYSLAILYQEMLTGVRPFPGNTPAQLAAQHMHGKPNLAPLPRGDQATVAKALAKDPELRFKHCREFVEELSAQRRNTKKAFLRRQTKRDVTATDSNTMGLSHGHDVTAVITDRKLPFVGNQMELQDPPELAEASISPTLMIGLGESGNRVIQKAKRLLAKRHQGTEHLPALRFLAVDCDRKSLSNLWRTSGDGGLSNSEILEIPLRKPEDYRKRIQKHLAWLSRRWIYNVPRSLQTEGLRPLGRLAYADHFETICDRIQDIIRDMATEESLAQTADKLDLDPGKLNPKIVIVTSVSGGIGSGMVLDLAYTARLLSHECGLPADSVTGLLMHSTYQRYRDPGLSAANAFALLTELRHYAENGFPGDPSLGMPEFEEHPPFDTTYFDELGHDLCQSIFDQKIGTIAEYLTNSTTTRSSAFFDACRNIESDQEHFSLRTFGIAVAGPDHQDGNANTIQRVSKGLIRRWLTCPEPANEDPADTKTNEFGISDKQLDELLSQVVDNRSEVDLNRLHETGIAQVIAQPHSAASTLETLAQQAFGAFPSNQDAGYTEPKHCLQIFDDAGLLAQGYGEKLSEEIYALLSGANLRLGEAKTKCQQITRSIQSVSSDLESQGSKLQADLQARYGQLNQTQFAKLDSNDVARTQFEELVKNCLTLRRKEYVLRVQRHFLRILGNSIIDTDGVLGRFVNQLTMLDRDLDNARLMGCSETDNNINVDQLILADINLSSQAQIEATEILVFENLVQPLGGYAKVLEDPSVWQNQLVREIKSHARRVVNEQQKNVSLGEIFVKQNINAADIAKWFSDRIGESQPTIHDCGGSKRLLLSIPERSNDVELFQVQLQALGIHGAIIPATHGNFVFCHEGENINLSNVAYRLLQARPDAVELVKRIQSRNDITWVSLDDLL